MNNQDQYDLLIIGGGMIGASMACAIANLPLRIAIIEAFPFRANNQPSYDARSIALAYGSKRIFETLNLWPAMEKDATPIEHIHISTKGQFGVTRLHAKNERLDALGYVLENRIIGNALLEKISRYDNIELICPAKLESLEVQADHAVVTI